MDGSRREVRSVYFLAERIKACHKVGAHVCWFVDRTSDVQIVTPQCHMNSTVQKQHCEEQKHEESCRFSDIVDNLTFSQLNTKLLLNWSDSFTKYIQVKDENKHIQINIKNRTNSDVAIPER